MLYSHKCTSLSSQLIPLNVVSIIVGRRFKFLLILELIVCFAPVVALLILGLLIIPVSFVMDPRASNLDALAMIVGGICGMVGVFSIGTAVMSGKRPRISTPVIVIFATLGIASLLPIVVGSVDYDWWRLIGLLPILASLHLVYLARALLFNHPPAGQDQA